MNRAGASLVEADRALTREDEFAYFELSTTTQRPPVLMFQRGLPDWLILRRYALRLAREETRKRCRLMAIRRFGFGRCIFVCNTEDGRSVFVDANEGKV